MANVLSDLVDKLKGSREAVLPSARVFPRLDIEQLAAELRLDTRGREDGQANQPAPDTSLETAAEGDVRAEIERRASKALEEYRVQLDLYEGRMRRGLILANLRTSIEAAGERALSDFDVQATDDLNHLRGHQQLLDGRQREFDAFRAANRLARLPHLDRGKTVRILLIVLFVLLESGLNGMFFAEGSKTGIIGGVLQALVLSVFNVGLGASYGFYGLPLLRHVSPVSRTLGAGLMLAYLVLAVTLNLSIGHFRDLFIAHQGVVALHAVTERVSSSPFGLADTQSLLLVLLGFGFSIGALISAARLDDPYPGYGAIARRREAAARACVDHTSRCVNDLTIRRDQAITDLSSVIEEVRAKEYDVQLALNGRARLHDEYRAYVEHLGDSYLRLIQRYRQANTKARAGEAPLGFRTAPTLSLSADQLPPLEGMAVDPAAMLHVIARMEFFIKAISAEYDKHARRYFPGNLAVDGHLQQRADG